MHESAAMYLNLSGRIPTVTAPADAKNASALKKAAEEFEAVFINQLLKVMRETIEESGLTGEGCGKSIYTELFDQEISLSMARRGMLGISDMITRDLAADQSKETGPVHGTHTRAPVSVEIDPAPGRMQLPVHASVSSRFGMRKDPFSGQARFHRGVDLAAPEGTKVVAALPGRVVFAGYQSGYGNTVVIQHDKGLQTRYGHLKDINVKAGDSVTSENMVGTVGSTGRSTGPHLHFEVIRQGNQVDPLKILNARLTRESVPGL